MFRAEDLSVSRHHQNLICKCAANAGAQWCNVATGPFVNACLVPAYALVTIVSALLKPLECDSKLTVAVRK